MGNCCSSRNKPHSENSNINIENRSKNINKYVSSLVDNIRDLEKNINDIRNKMIQNNIFSETKIYKHEHHSSNIGLTTENIPISRRKGKNYNPTATIPKEPDYIKKLNNCHDSQVYLLNNNIVLKKYPKSRSGTGQFTNEIATYRHLSNCSFILDIIQVDFSLNSFTIPYLSGKPYKNDHNKNIIEEYLKILNKTYGVERLYTISWGNVICDNRRLYLIDFGGVPFNYNPGGKVKWRIKNIRNIYK